MNRRSMLYLGSLAALGCLAKTKDSKIQALERMYDYEGEIKKKVIPSSGEQIPIVGMGTWRTFDVGSAARKRSELNGVLKNLFERGGRVIDSSPMYGSSESVLGDLSTELKINSPLFLATKVWITGKEAGIRQMNESFAKMQTSVMDLMQVHNLVDVQTHLKTLREWKESGKIRHFGFTHYAPGAYPELVKLIKTEKPDFVQFNYNLSAREAEQELLPLAKEKGVAVIINRPFEEGALFPLVRAKSLPSWAADYEIKTWSQFFLKFIVSHPSVTCAIPATSNPVHMLENIGAAYGILPDEKGRKKMAEHFLKEIA